MRQLVKSTQLYATATARGGWAQMTDVEFGQVGLKVADQYAFLNRFTVQVQQGLPLDGRFLNRVEQYAQSSRGTFFQVFSDEMAARGKTEERNILHNAERHCEGDTSCVEESKKGWVPIGTLIPIGDRLCKRGCKCSIQIR